MIIIMIIKMIIIILRSIIITIMIVGEIREM